MPDSTVVQELEAFKRRLLRGDRAQTRTMAQAWLVIERKLDAQIVALVADVKAIQDAGRPVNGATISRLGRFQLLMEQVRNELAGFAAEMAEIIEEAGSEIVVAGTQQAAAAVSTITGGTVAASVDFLPVAAVRNLVGFVANGTPLAAWLADAAITAEMQVKVRNALIEGVALGRNPRKVARQIKNSLSGGLNRALNTARTVQMNAFREAFREQMLASGVVSGYRRLAAKDDRTCMGCLMDDGAFYPIDQRMPEHNQGRCTALPVVDGFPPVQFKQGRDWFLEQDAATQRKMLGNGRYEAYRDGRFDLDQLITVRRDAVWGDSIQVTGLKNLVG